MHSMKEALSLPEHCECAVPARVPKRSHKICQRTRCILPDREHIVVQVGGPLGEEVIQAG